MDINLPKEWRFCSLKDIGKIISGGTPSTTESSYWGNDIAWITPADLSGYTAKQISKGRKSISNEGLKNSSARILPKGTVLFSSRAPIGYVAIASNDLATNQGFKSIVPNADVDSNYLYYYLKHNKRLAEESASGTTFKEISSSKFSELPFRYPSLSEQHQIVEKIEELFSELDKGIENLRTAQQQLKVYRKAVLKWAFEGRLTNENLKEGELPDGWEWIKLRDTCDKIQDGSHFSPQVQYDEPGENRYMYITAKNIRNNYMDFRKLYYVDKDYHESIYGRCNPEYGDVLLTKDGINTGEITLNTLKEPFSLLSSVCLFKPKKDKLRAELLKYFIQSPFGNKVILQSMTGTAIKRIILGKIKDAKISLPPLKEQLEIILEIESRLSVCDKMEETITTSLQQAEALRQSILKRAFEGKLVKAEAVKKEAKIIPIILQRGLWERKILAAYIILMCYKDQFFGHTKFQKTLYLCEQHAQLDFETDYLKMVAGPLDKFIYEFLREAKKNQWLTEVPKGPIIYFEPMDGIGELTKQYPQYFKSVSTKINFVIKLLQGKDTNGSELIATIYAIWNNYAIEKQELTGESLVAEVYDWAEEKMKFKPHVILSTWQWMKEEKLVPVGFGKVITKSKQSAN